MLTKSTETGMDTVSPGQPLTLPMVVTTGTTTRRVDVEEVKGLPQAPLTSTRYTVLFSEPAMLVILIEAAVAPLIPLPLARLVQVLPLCLCH